MTGPKTSSGRRLAILYCTLFLSYVSGFIETRQPRNQRCHGVSQKTFPVPAICMSSSSTDDAELAYLKSELEMYLKKRQEEGADEKANEVVGRVVGGTRGNAILDFVSGAPNKPIEIESPPNPLDYDELVKYGYGHLVTKIMQAGGRNRMYQLLGLPEPAIKWSQTTKAAPPLVIDQTDDMIPGRYTGLKLGQIMDDDLQAAALEKAQKKDKDEEMDPRRTVVFEKPFADKRNVGPPLTPDWTPERLDEWGRRQGRALAWARKAREGLFVTDRMETLDLSWEQRVYSIFTALMIAASFGRSTPALVEKLNLNEPYGLLSVVETLQAPAVALILASVGSGAWCVVQAAGKNRGKLVWMIKGTLGGPLTVRQLQDLGSLKTLAESRSESQPK